MKPWQRHALVGGTTLALLGPSAPWVLTAWRASPLDAQGWIFAALAVVWWNLVMPLGRTRETGIDHSAWPILILGVCVGAAGLYFDVRLMVAIGALGVIWGVTWALCGAALGMVFAPALLCGVFALPTTTFLLGRGLLALGLPAAYALPLKAVLAALALLLGLGLLIAHVRGWSPRVRPAVTGVAVLAAVAAGALGVAMNPPELGPPARLDEAQWTFGTWIGAEIAASPNEQSMFEDCRLSKRIFAGRKGERVSVLIVESEDVHRIHSPEYCLSGSGWQVQGRARAPWTLGPKATAAETLTATRGGQSIKGVYWFSSPSRSTLDLAGLRLQSRLAPGEAFTLYLVTVLEAPGQDQDQVLQAFLAAAPWLS
jgi:hypothetical protein